MTNENCFNPDWPIPPPGATIADLLQERSWTQNELAFRLDYTPKHVGMLIKGKATINDEAALKLERVLGSSVGFWLTREARYRESLTRQNEFSSLKNDVDWLKELPLRDMIDFGWVEKFSDKAQQVAACLRYFGVASVDIWRNKWTNNLAAFRSKKFQEKHKGSVATWIRQCERRAEILNCQSYDSHKFKDILLRARGLTNEENTDILIKKLVELCAHAGVLLVVVPAPKGCPAYGATRWLTPEKALIMLNDRYKTNDQFWFSFFHESAHVLLHAKKILYIDTEGQLDGEDEEKADDFASNHLIPPENVKELSKIQKDKNSIIQFANSVGIAPGIVVGRMQRDKLISWRSPLNKLKHKIELNNFLAN
jgi:plasmid maintenance system antidote protein VapI/Zn-dependent peptidase ImmA (M78 family)